MALANSLRGLHAILENVSTCLVRCHPQYLGKRPFTIAFIAGLCRPRNPRPSVAELFPMFVLDFLNLRNKAARILTWCFVKRTLAGGLQPHS